MYLPKHEPVLSESLESATHSLAATWTTTCWQAGRQAGSIEDLHSYRVAIWGNSLKFRQTGQLTLNAIKGERVLAATEEEEVFINKDYDNDCEGTQRRDWVEW